MFERWVLEDLRPGRESSSQGHKVGLLFGSANHDESVVRQPRRDWICDGPSILMFPSEAGSTTAWGPLAKVELEVAFASFAARVGKFDVVSEPRASAISRFPRDCDRCPWLSAPGSAS